MVASADELGASVELVASADELAADKVLVLGKVQGMVVESRKVWPVGNDKQFEMVLVLHMVLDMVLDMVLRMVLDMVLHVVQDRLLVLAGALVLSVVLNVV